MSWGELFDRAGGTTTLAAIDETLARRRERGDAGAADSSDARDDAREAPDPSPARLVADADVLAADLLVGGDAREALDHVRAHSWTTLVASDALLADAEAVIAELADAALAADWREHVETVREPVAQPLGDHPALASAYRGGAMHVLTFDEGLQSASAGAAIRGHVETSVKHPRAFATLFDAEPLYEAVEGGVYPGPDRDPRA